MRRFAQFGLAAVVTVSLMLSPVIQGAFAGSHEESNLSREDLVKLLQKRIEYVFVIFNENHSFDNEFDHRQSVVGLRSNAADGRFATLAGLARKDPGQCRNLTPSLWWTWMPSHRDRA